MSIQANSAQTLILTLPTYKGKYVGFFHSGGSAQIRGWWERKNGSEGGELHIDAKEAEVCDFDGACDLPQYVREELSALNIAVNF